MARPQKAGLDYFSLDVKMSDEISLIEAKFGVAGFGIVIKLYQIIYDSGYFILWTERELLLYSNRINADINLINDVIAECLKWNVFNKELYEKYNILTSHGIQKRYIEATQRRKSVDFIAQYLLEIVDKKYSNQVNVNIYQVNVNNNRVNSNISTQSKVKESKVKESKELQVKFQPDLSAAYFENQNLNTAFIDFIKNRKDMKNPITEKGFELALKKLNDPSHSDVEKIEALEKATLSNWQGIFFENPSPGKFQPKQQKTSAIIQQMREEGAFDDEK